MQKISPFLWFDDQAEEAAKFYVSIFKHARMGDITHATDAGPGEPGRVLTVEFELAGQSFVGLNGGPMFRFNEAVSFQINCETQDEVDYYWDRLLEGGGSTQACGWLKDKYGVSWQVTPTALFRLLKDPDRARAARVMQAMLQMVKIDIAEIERAAKG